jgi:hypothetical protein
LGYSCNFSTRKGTDTSRSGTRSLASVPFLLRFFEVVEVSGRYLPVNGYSEVIAPIHLVETPFRVSGGKRNYPG